MKHSLDPSLGQTTIEQKLLCDRFSQIVNQESPEQLLSQVQALWIDGSDYPDEQIQIARDSFLSYNMPQEAFNVCLYQCCQILLEAWQKNPETEAAIPQLVDLVTGPPQPDADAYWRSRNALRLNERMQRFRQSDRADSLQQFLGLLQPKEIPLDRLENHPLKSLLYRYPYLYSYSLIVETSGNLSHIIRRIKAKRTKNFEVSLSQYIIDKVRLSRTQKNGKESRHKHHKLISKNNPTFLSDKELNRSLQEYIGKVSGSQTNRDLAQSFGNYYQTSLQYYGEFKAVLYQYITRNLTSKYCTRQLNPLLEKQLNNILPKKDDDPIADFLIVRTCAEVLHFLVVENAPPYKHTIFMNLIANLGPIRTTSLLMRIILICPQVRPQLEKQLWMLFKHYQQAPCPTVKGLIKIWENYNIALAAYFGKADLSWCLQIPRAR